MVNIFSCRTIEKLMLENLNFRAFFVIYTGISLVEL